MSYSDLLKDPRWQRKRLEILSRDNFSCQMCKDTEKTLHVHHLSYSKGKPWDVDNIELVTYCETCHQIVEDLKNQNGLIVKKIYRQNQVKGPNFYLAEIVIVPLSKAIFYLFDSDSNFICLLDPVEFFKHFCE